MMVQRALAARTISHARGGTILAGYLKILPLFMIIFPGMISRILFPDTVACNQPSTCQSICHNQRRCTNIAYPTLVLNILPHGVKGIMLAIMLAALISGLTSIFNSASTIFTVDIYPNVLAFRRKNITNRELMIVGRLFVILMTVVGIAWIPVVIELQGVELYTYMQQVIGFLAPPIACIYILAVLWKRTNESGAFAGLMVGFVFGLLRMILEFSKQPPLCGENDSRFWLVTKVNFMYYSLFLFWLTLITCVSVSLCTQPPTEEQLYRTTFWTKNQQKSTPEHVQMLDAVNHETPIVSQPIDVTNTLPETHRVEKPDGCNVFVLVKACWSWFCGLDDDHDNHQGMVDKAPHEDVDLMAHHREERPLIKWILNINLIIILLLEISLMVLFSLPVKYTFWRN
ncbi:unnamed protein product [Adineta ricciae]|uniref:Uncharacterized protein n=2 Tax=Adineta ricciae TaxID=249248 RepID=A0A814VCX8_ADIRI|nr:unnamed protein product [Adineta ricciae]